MISRLGLLFAAVIVTGVVCVSPVPSFGDEGSAGKPPKEQAKTEKPAPKQQAAEKKAAEEKPAKPPLTPGKKTKKKNPLSDLLNKVLTPNKGRRKKRQPKQPGEKPQKPDAKNRRKGSTTRRSIETPQDPRIAGDRPLLASLQKAESELENQRWKSAVRHIQRILDFPQDSFCRRPRGRWTSIHAQARRLLGSLPDVEMQAYRAQYEGVARRHLDEGETAGLVAAATRFFHTDSGQTAANTLASTHLDHGEYGLADFWFQALRDANSPICQDSRWRAKAAFATKQLLAADSKTPPVVATLPPLAGTAPLGGESRDLSKWLESAPTVAASADPLDEWPQFFGTASRSGKPAGGRPLLLSRWFEPLSRSHRIRDRIQRLVEDLSDKERVTVPTATPVMVDGKAAFRTLRGVQVIDAESGASLWETQDRIPAERLLSQNGSQQSYGSRNRFFGGGGFRGGMLFDGYSGRTESSGPLGRLMFDDPNYGTISSDGRRLFVIEEMAVLSRNSGGYGGWGQTSPKDQFGQDWSSSKLTAYDLQTGRPLWEVGGSRFGDIFELPLAGYFFHGVPVVNNGELLIVGEKERRIQLFCLDAVTGRERWSLVLANSQADIASDIARRRHGAQASVGEGVIVCPTTTGLVIAVDRQTHALLWTYNITPQLSQARGMGRHQNSNMVRDEPLNKRWSPAPPVISGNRVVLTAPRSQYVLCLDLLTGRKIWQKSKGTDLLYLAGVFDDHVVVVGKKNVRSLSLKSSKSVEQWHASLPSPPCGRGVASGNRFHLPLASGNLLSLDLETGKVLEQSSPPEGSRGLGNLAMYRGAVYSLSPFGLEAFEQREQAEADIQQRKSRDPHDPIAGLREAEIVSLTGDISETLKLLRGVSREKLSELDRGRFRSLYFDSLVRLIRADVSQHDDAVEELNRLIETPHERMLFQRLIADRMVSRKSFKGAFEAYLKLADFTEVHLIRPSPDSNVRVRNDMWLAGRLMDLWKQLPEPLQKQLDGRITELAAKVADQDVETRLRWLTLFDFHSAALPVQQGLVEYYADSRDLVAAEGLLMQIRESAAGPVAAAAVARWAKLLLDAGDKADAVHVYGLLERDDAETVLPDGRSVTEILAAARSNKQMSEETPRYASLSWGDENLTAVRFGQSYNGQDQTVPLEGLDEEFPFFSRYRLHVQQQNQRLEIVHAGGKQYHALIPLRGNADHSAATAAAFNSGHHLLLVHQGVVHSISPLEKRVRWTHPLSQRAPRPTYNASSGSRLKALKRISMVVRPQRGRKTQSLFFSDGRYFGFRSRRQFTVLKAETGEVCWKLENVLPETTFFGGGGYVYSSGGGKKKKSLVARRLMDGRTVDIPYFSKNSRKTKLFIGRNVLVSGVKGSTFHLTLYDPVLNQNLWKTEFPQKTLAARDGKNHLLLLKPSGELSKFDLLTGTNVSLGQVDEKTVQSRVSVFGFQDNENTYLVVNQTSSDSQMRDSGNIPSIRVSGKIFAFDRNTGQPRWQYTVKKKDRRDLILSQISYSPVLLFTTRKSQSVGRRPRGTIQTMNIVALNKQTGRQLLDATIAMQPNLESLHVNPTGQYIELRTYNERIRLMPLRKETASASRETKGAP